MQPKRNGRGPRFLPRRDWPRESAPADRGCMSYPSRSRAPTAPMSSLESLERRQLLAAAFPTAYEQYLVELINRGRANPTAEATRYGTDLNEGLNPGRISSTPKQPLAMNPLLTDAARKHSQWMIDNDIFSHNEGSTDPEARMRAAGYPFNLPWTWGENIGWSGTTGSVDVTSRSAGIH